MHDLYIMINTILTNWTDIGKPLPKVTWWRESRLLDSKSENVVQGRVRNTLRIAHLNRSDIGMTLTCQAANNNVSVPASTATVVDMKRKFLLNPASTFIIDLALFSHLFILFHIVFLLHCCLIYILYIFWSLDREHKEGLVPNFYKINVGICTLSYNNDIGRLHPNCQRKSQDSDWT